MLCNQVTYDGEVLLTMYHRYSDDVSAGRELRKEEIVDGKTLVFEEYVVSDELEFEELEYEVVFLPVGAPMNPYKDHGSVQMQHFKNLQKPTKLFEDIGEKYELLIPVEEFSKINQFIYDYTGFNIKQFPMIYGDILVFEPCFLKMQKREQILVVDELSKGILYFMKFKLDDKVVATKMKKIENNKKNYEIDPKARWNSVDIDLFNQDTLIYSQKDLSFMEQMIVTSNIVEEQEVPLNQLGESVTLRQITGSQEIATRNNLDEEQVKLDKTNLSILRQLDRAEEKSSTLFLRPGEENLALEEIKKQIEESSDEFWLFDPYFGTGLSISIDIVRMLLFSSAKSKNIVFYGETTEQTIMDNLCQKIEEDIEFARNLKQDITLWETEDTIHDRFIIKRNGEDYSGITIGTSLNSLHSNHYCITTLNHTAAKIILDELTDFLKENISDKRVI